jgi:hypothetical protein
VRRCFEEGGVAAVGRFAAFHHAESRKTYGSPRILRDLRDLRDSGRKVSYG